MQKEHDLVSQECTRTKLVFHGFDARHVAVRSGGELEFVASFEMVYRRLDLLPNLLLS